MRLSIAVVLLVAMGAGTTAQVPAPVELSWSAPASITLNEPVIATFRIRNASADPVTYEMGTDQLTNFRFELTAPDRSKVVRRPTVTATSGVLKAASVAPGQTYAQDVVLTEWLDFPTVGRYSIALSFAGALRTGKGAIAGVERNRTIEIQVLPRNPDRLAVVCRRLAGAALDPAAKVSARTVVAALASVRDPIALPFLVSVAERGTSASIAVAGIGRIGGADARTALEALAKHPDREVAAIAADALKRMKKS